MAGLDGSGSSRAEEVAEKSEKKSIAIYISINVARRKVTLIIIAILLNVLHWSAVVCLATSVYQIASNPHDNTSIPAEVLTLTSGVATLSYTYLHTIVSLKQKIWAHRRGHASAIKRTSYIAVRFAVSLCALWLLTSGWNMIIVARRPVCLSDTSGLQAWEVGTTCRVARLGMTFAMISLTASCMLFGVLAVVRRPFEAHLFKHGYEAPVDPFATPAASRNTSPMQNDPYASDERLSDRRRSMSTGRNDSAFDVQALDLSSSPPPPTLHAPSPRRAVGLGIFTSDLAPPPIPAEFVAPKRTSSLESLPPLFQPSMSHYPLMLPPRLSGQVLSSGLIPLSTAPQFSASTWRALHPISPTSVGSASHSYPHLPSSGYPYHHRFSRSSVSLTRPRRLSTATPTASVAWSSRSESTGPEERETSTSIEDERHQRASVNDIAFLLYNGTSILDTSRPKTCGKHHMRTISAPDTTAGAPQPLQADRMAMGWKPQLAGTIAKPSNFAESEVQSIPIKIARIVRSSSANLLSRFSPDSSPDDSKKTSQRELERNSDGKAGLMKELPVPRSRSVDCLAHARISGDASSGGQEATGHNLNTVKNRILHTDIERKMVTTFNEVKNKPLPKIAML